MTPLYTTARGRVVARLVSAVSFRLGVLVTFERWATDPATGCDVPVFRVPASAVDAARLLGLRVVPA